MLIKGWKEVSTVDVRGKVTFTLWVCGCNLKCPFCHNWRIADGLGCHELNREKLLEHLEGSSRFVDYFHVTGGEPLVQRRELAELLEDVKSMGIMTSLNSNLTLPMGNLLELDLVDHVATDVKAPPGELYGLPGDVSLGLWRTFIENVDLVSDYGVLLELRIPVARGLDAWPRVREVLDHLKTNFYVVLNPLVGSPVTCPRDPDWCSKHCWPRGEVKALKTKLEGLGVRVYLSNLPWNGFWNSP